MMHQARPFIRHTNMNPEQILDFQPGVTKDLIINGVIGLRSAVEAGLGWSVVPAMSIQKSLQENKIIKVEIPTHVKDDVSVWWLRARKDTAIGSKLLAKWISEFEVI